MKILVTGGCGFVGRNLIKKLLDKKSNKVYCIDPVLKHTGGIIPPKWPNFNPLKKNNFYYKKIDCREYFESTKIKFDKIYHLAAIVGGRMMIDYNPLAVAIDLSIDSLMWSFAKKNKIKKIVNFSSSAVYPTDLQTKKNYRLLKESDVIFDNKYLGQPDMTYGWSKLTSEYLGKIAYEKHGIKSVVFRPFSGYGPDQDLTYPFTSICLRAIKHKKKNDSFKVWGSGEQMRDFIHIEDCINGILSLEDKINNGDSVNLSNGKFLSFKNLSKIILNELNIDSTVEGMSLKPEGVFARAGDTKLQKKLGFVPKVGIKDGIKDCIEFLKKINK